MDPCKHSKPYQIVVACIQPSSTLADTVADMEKKIASTPASDKDFGPNDSLIIPNIFYQIVHHFKELQGIDKKILNKRFGDFYIETALQSIKFKLDKRGRKIMSKWVDLRKASEITGIGIEGIKKRIKGGKIHGRKVPCKDGHKWQVLLDSIPGHKKVEKKDDMIETQEIKQVAKSQDKLASFFGLVIKEKDERLLEQRQHISTLESLLTDFQERIKVLESYNVNLEQKLKLLPAPPEDIVYKLHEKEKEVVEKEKILDEIQEILRKEISSREVIEQKLQDIETRLESEKHMLLEEQSKRQKETQMLSARLKALVEVKAALEDEKEKAEKTIAAAQEEKTRLQLEKNRLAVHLNEERVKYEKEVEVFSSQVRALTESKNAVEKEKQEAQEIILTIQKDLENLQKEKEELKEKLKSEQKRPWWKKLFKLK